MNRLKDLREDKDLTQENIAKFLNIPRSTYSEYEIERREIPINLLIKLSKYYGTSIDYILCITNNNKAYNISNNKKEDFNRLKKLRLTKNKTQKEISLELSIPLSSYRKYEQMQVSINHSLLKIFANYFNTSIDYIIYNTDNIISHEKNM